MPTALALLTNLDLERNQLLRAALELVAAPDATPVTGQIAFTDGTITALPKWSVIIRDGETPTPGWRVLGAINKAHTITGFWTFKPDFTAAGAPAAAGDPPFGVDPLRFGRVPNLTADMVDSWHASSPVPDGSAAPPGSFLPVYDTFGRLAVADPVNPYNVVNLQTLQAASQGISPRDPCQYATTANLSGGRSGNVLTGSPVGVLAVDGLNPSVGERVLVKNQTLPADNGIYSVTNAGAVGAAWILTRASDADATAEVRVGTTTYIEKGNTNLSTQWQCSAAGTLNTDPNLWVKSFQQSAYLAGKGMVLAGLTFHFGTSSNYTVNALWYNSSTSALSQLAPPGSLKFLQSPSGGPPAWADVAWADIAGKPTLPTAPGAGGTVGRHTRWAASNALEDSNLLDSSTAVVGAGNSLAAATISLGNDTAPFASVWTNELRLKTTAGAGPVAALYGLQNATNDPNLNHRKVVTWGVSDLKSWLVYSPAEIGAVPTDRTLTINGAAGQINVATQAAWDLSANRTWALSLDLDTLDTHWVTLHTDQSLSGRKSWYSATSSASEEKIRVGVGVATEPTWSVRAGGVVSWGDGIAPAAATIDFANNRLRFDGRPVQFETTATLTIKSAAASSGAPTTLLGLNGTDDLRKVSAADLTTYLGQPALAAGAIGFGDAGGKLTGDATKLNWDATNSRLGVNMTGPQYTFDVTGTLNQQQIIASGTTGVAVYPGIRSVTSDTSNSSTDWTNRTMIASWLSTTKSGTATFVTASTLENQRIAAFVTGGSVSSLVGQRIQIGAGNATTGATATTVIGSYVTPLCANASVGTITNLYQFMGSDSTAPLPQPSIHYVFRSPNITSGAGATRTAAFVGEVTTGGTGERFNLYMSGAANNFISGNLGLGQTAPTARLELGVGTTTLAPVRFSPSSTSATLLTTALSGMVESRGDHLTFTDTASPAARHILAHQDDPNFTNDAAADQGGAVVLGIADKILCTITGEQIGTSDVTVWVRFLVPTAVRQTTRDGLFSLTASSTTGVFANALNCWFNTTGALEFFRYGATTTDNRMLSYPGFLTAFGGKVIDAVFIRSGNTASLYVNGILQSGNETTGGSQPLWSDPLDTGYFILGQNHTSAGYGAVARFHRAAVFNRTLSPTELKDLSSYGVHDWDQWGSQIAAISSDFTTGDGGWFGADGASNTPVTWNQTVNGTPGWLTITRMNSAGRCELVRTVTGYRPQLRWRMTGTFYRSTAEPSYMGGSQGGTQGTAAAKVALPSSANTAISLELGPRNASVVTVQPRWEPGVAAGSTVNVTLAQGSSYSVKNVALFIVGAILDLNLGFGCGAGIPDRSGRYHGVLTGSGWYHYTSKCPVPITSGAGTLTYGLRRYSETITAKDNDLVTITHGLGTSNLVIAVWNAAGETVQVAARRKTGSETTAIEIGFGLVASPVTPISFLVLIIG